MDDLLRERIERYLAGGLTDAEAGALFEALRRDPGALAHLGRVLVQQAHLRDAMRDAGAAALRAASEGPPASRRAAWGWAAAACAAVAVGAVLFSGSRAASPIRPGAPAPPGMSARDGTGESVARAPVGSGAGSQAGVSPSAPPDAGPATAVLPPASLARLVSVAGPAFVVTDAGRILAHADAPLVPGQGVRTEGPDGRAVLSFPGGSRLTLGAETSVTLFDAGRGHTLLLAGGTVDASLVSAAAGPDVLLVTPHAEVSASDARLVLRCATDGTRIDVASGRARFTRGLDRETLEVAAGQCAAAAVGEAFVARPTGPDAPPPAPIPAPEPAAAAAAPVATSGRTPGPEPVGPAPPGALPAVGGGAPTRSITARLERVQGDVRILGDSGASGRRDPARAGDAILSGQGIETFGAGAFAVAVCLDATRIEIGPDARAFFDAEGNRVSLDYGAIRADVSKQPRGASVVLGTPHAEVRVLGTRFLLASDPKSTTVEVEEGRVRLARREDGASVVVLPRQYASVRGRAPLVSRPVRIWRSEDTVMNPPGAPPAVVPDLSGRRAARLEFYESGRDGGVEPGRPLSVFVPGRHLDFGNRDRFNHCDQYWAHAPKAYPYAGKSNVGRGEDEGERGAPPPLGVRDLQLHPPNNDRLTVAAFVVPVAGLYRVRDLGVRRVDARGGPVRYLVFDAQDRPIAELTATPDRAWVWESRSFALGFLQAGDRIRFAVARAGDYGWDAAEIAWTVTATE